MAHDGESLTMTLILYGSSTLWYDLSLEALVYLILKHLHEENHCGMDALMDLIRPHLKSPHLQRIIQTIICQIHAQNNLPKTILKQDVLQQEREYNIKGYACVKASNLTLHRCLKP